ncbi:MAG: hypothetical protein CL886_07195 [Dehalococcoidia bacterium]|nr:hypothetical protein [Dehalococcoidia bacterium]|tara:strand:+ start:9863 stop:10867 length:1005 start_codon:yes stop_codon:yes gene_type:complete
MVTRNNYKILVTDYVWPSTDPEREVLSSIGATLIEAPDQNESTLITLASDVDAIMTCFAQVTANVVKAAKNCLVISRYGVGVDNIAVSTATEEGIPVTYVPDYCVDEVSDHVMALLFTWNRQLLFYDKVAKKGDWGGSVSPVPLRRLKGKNFGVIGLGRIGLAVANKAHALGINVLGYDPYVSSDTDSSGNISVTTLEDLLEKSDYISVHTPLNDDTRGLIGETELSKMKSSCYLINCARGPIVDESALYQALISGSIAGAGLDVLEDTEPSADNPLFGLDNVVITPHVAFLSSESVHDLEVRTAQATRDVLLGKMPDFLVNPAVLPVSRINLH